jgi:DNA polymerase-1
VPVKKKSTPTESAPPAAQPVVPTPKSEKPRIFLIDAMSFIFRAYHAMARQRPMSTKTGIPTAATYVFVNMLNKLRDDFSPELIAAIFDMSGPTFRDEQAKAITSVRKFDIKTQQFEEIAYHGYKANRAEMPPDLAAQLPYIRRALDAYRIPILELQGFEADDVIGTLARKAAERGHPVYIVSSDKDMMQLVGGDVCVLNPTKDNLVCDAAKVEEIIGVPPEQVIDVMALRGDSIDNVPGAPGIGEKGSVEIIRRFGSVESALEHADEVEKKTYRESLKNNREVILLSKQLVTIEQNAAVALDTDAMRAQPPDVDACRALFNELEFNTLLKSVLPETELKGTDYREITSETELKPMLDAARKRAGLAVVFGAPSAHQQSEEAEAEESELEAQASIGFAAPAAPQQSSMRIGISAEAGKAAIVDLSSEAGASLKMLLADDSLPKVVHDLKAALHRARELGISIRGVHDDVLLYSYLTDPTYASHGLNDVAVRRLNLKLSGEPAQAADVLGRIAPDLKKEVDEQQLRRVYEEIDLPLVPVLARMEEAGVKVDTGALGEMSVRLGTDCDAVARRIWDASGEQFNINSPKQLGDVLFNKLMLPKPIKYGKGKTISTAVDVLEELAATHEVPKLVLEYRQLSKLKSTYVDTLPMLIEARTGRIHTTFNHAGTATGRLSSVNPNLQNIPIRTELGRSIRAAFIAEPGHVLLAADYSQVELRLLAHFSGDELLSRAFRNEDDIHSLTAQEVFGVPPMMINEEHRRRAKAINYGIVYGLSPFGLAQQLSIEQKEAKQYIETFFVKYAGVRKFIDATLEETRQRGHVRTLFGRLRPIPDINSKNPNMRGFAERTAVNTPLQGTAADLIKVAMIRIDALLRERKMNSRMTLQVHDELVFEVPLAEVDEMKSLVREQMEQVHPLSVPLLVDLGVGKNWRDLE